MSMTLGSDLRGQPKRTHAYRTRHATVAHTRTERPRSRVCRPDDPCVSETRESRVQDERVREAENSHHCDCFECCTPRDTWLAFSPRVRLHPAETGFYTEQRRQASLGHSQLYSLPACVRKGDPGADARLLTRAPAQSPVHLLLWAPVGRFWPPAGGEEKAGAPTWGGSAAEQSGVGRCEAPGG
jgi:hypothetical protein